MVRSTIIARASDALPLAASSDDEEVRVAFENVVACGLTCRLSYVPHFPPTERFARRMTRRRLRCTSTSNSRSSSFAASHPTLNLNALLRVGSTHFSARYSSQLDVPDPNFLLLLQLYSKTPQIGCYCSKAILLWTTWST